jgi:hypothetical protein
MSIFLEEISGRPEIRPESRQALCLLLTRLLVFLFFFSVLRIEPRALHMPGKHSSSRLNPSSIFDWVTRVLNTLLVHVPYQLLIGNIFSHSVDYLFLFFIVSLEAQILIIYFFFCLSYFWCPKKALLNQKLQRLLLYFLLRVV